jgi:uncharacterized protein (DUF1501 family)
MKEKTFNALSRRQFIRRATCAAIGTVGMTSALRDLRLMNAAVAQSNITDYKALVCIFLAGGNDSNNLIIPTLTQEYKNYASIRTPYLAVPRGALLNLKKPGTSIDYVDPAGHTFGFHPACPELQTLFGEGKLAALFNTGTLVYPITRDQYQAGTLPTPPQLFSHADQQLQWQTSIPDQPAITGWGGRCADLLNSLQPGAPISLSVSLAGANTFEIGNQVAQYSVSTDGAIPLAAISDARLTTLTNILGLSYANLQKQAYAGIAQHSIQSGNLLNNAITNTAATSYWRSPFPVDITVPNGGIVYGSGLSAQLLMVARLIEAGNRAAANGGFGMKRQIFFCEVDGYDLHNGQTQYTNATPSSVIIGAHADLLAELSQSLYAFQRSMEQLGLSQNVTAFTASDFGRTFPSNGEGSDHGWGGHHLICGGAVKGGQTYGTFPTLAVDGPDDTDTGRWIPTSAIDQYFATLARWFGVDSSNIPTLFPNVGRFAAPNLGFI